jgi:hypothetical protein
MFIVDEHQWIESSFRSDINIALVTERRLFEFTRVYKHLAPNGA